MAPLDPIWRTNTIPQFGKRRPIVYNRENKDTVLSGIARGVYDPYEVLHLTNKRGLDEEGFVDELAPLDDPDFLDALASVHDSYYIDELDSYDLEFFDYQDPNDEYLNLGPFHISFTMDTTIMDRMRQENSSDADQAAPAYDTIHGGDMISGNLVGDLEVDIDGVDGDEDEDEDEDEEVEEEEEGEEEGEEDNDDEVIPDDQIEIPFFDPAAMGLKEINNLAHLGVSSHKPGNGVEELLSDDLDKYWQYVSPGLDSLRLNQRLISRKLPSPSSLPPSF